MCPQAAELKAQMVEARQAEDAKKQEDAVAAAAQRQAEEVSDVA